MRDFVLVTLVGCVVGGFCAWGLLPMLVDRTTELDLGSVKIPVELTSEVYRRNEVLAAVFLASLCGALLASLLAAALRVGRSRRRR